MSPLEIALIAVFAFIALLFTIYLLILHSLKVNKGQTYEILNKHAKSGKFVFFGDSLTDFYPIQEFFDEPTIYNRGVAGDRTDHLLARINNVIDIAPSKLFLLIGTNDLGMGRSPKYTADNIKKIIQKIKEACPLCSVYILSQYPVRRNKNLLSQLTCLFRTRKRLKELDELNKLTAQELDCEYIDVYSSLCDEKGRLKKEYTMDGLHMTAIAYCEISAILDRYITQGVK